MRVINISSLAAVSGGIVVCLLVALLFTQAFTGLNLGVAASWAFALAMLLLLVSLLLFLLEVRLAIRAIQVPMDLLEGEDMGRSEEHTSELQSLMRISYAVFCLKKNKKKKKLQSKNAHSLVTCDISKTT